MATEKLTVAVLGAGTMGGTLGRKWITTGHQVVFGVSDPNGKHFRECPPLVLREEKGKNRER